MLLPTVTHTYAALNPHPSNHPRTCSWTLLPINIGSMGISIFLKPRQNKRRYKTILVLQCIMFLFADRILRLYYSRITILEFCLFTAIPTPLLVWVMAQRKRIGKLEDKELSQFLTQKVVKQSMLIGLAEISFLMFSSVQCANRSNWRECERTLYSQTCIGIMVVVVNGIR